MPAGRGMPCRAACVLTGGLLHSLMREYFDPIERLHGNGCHEEPRRHDRRVEQSHKHRLDLLSRRNTGHNKSRKAARAPNRDDNGSINTNKSPPMLVCCSHAGTQQGPPKPRQSASASAEKAASIDPSIDQTSRVRGHLLLTISVYLSARFQKAPWKKTFISA